MSITYMNHFSCLNELADELDEACTDAGRDELDDSPGSGNIASSIQKVPPRSVQP